MNNGGFWIGTGLIAIAIAIAIFPISSCVQTGIDAQLQNAKDRMEFYRQMHEQGAELDNIEGIVSEPEDIEFIKEKEEK